MLSLHIIGFLCQFSSFKFRVEQKRGGDERRAEQLEQEKVGGQFEERRGAEQRGEERGAAS